MSIVLFILGSNLVKIPSLVADILNILALVQDPGTNRVNVLQNPPFYPYHFKFKLLVENGYMWLEMAKNSFRKMVKYGLEWIKTADNDEKQVMENVWNC